ncbi:DUF4856 domain-containing protein [Polluticoccus soli]|uniref:DUF4856 domain-containing protein n=1 Tax=Polluticoccus soli TaxID=3034150 RepID=UPI0023E32634|nr:DUF4856 domain-containing protein [Flavipsychrobacter sp. JY13-12]
MKNQILFATAVCAALFTSSCKKDETAPVKVPYTSLSNTSNYFETFKGIDGKTSVDLSAATTRTAMVKEMDAYMKKGLTQNLEAQVLKNMFNNKNNAFTSATLNSASDITILSKLAESFGVDRTTEEQTFNSYFDGIALASSQRSNVAAAGQAGLLDNKYLVNEKGFEYGQFVQKGIIGAVLLDQVSNIYFGTVKQGADNKTLVSGKNYTQLEHNWDEAYGSLTQNEYYPKKDPNDGTKWLESYLGSYARQVNSTTGGPEAIYMAFLTGRAAIANQDMSKRDEQISIIRTNLEKAIATIAVSYLNKTKTATTDGAKFHALSEGYGFVYSLRFAYNAKINKAKSDELLNILGGKTNGFWSLTNGDLDNVRDQIATTFGIDKSAEVNH